MRSRRLIALFVAVAVTGVLAGCTEGADAPGDPEVPPPVDVCAAAAPSGATSGSIQVDGAVGSPATVSFAAPLTITSTERTVVVEGGGAPVDGSDLVEYAATVFDAATGELLQQQGYDEQATLPAAAVTVGPFVGCATVGSRIVVAVPETDQGGASVWVLDVLDTLPSAATGADQKPVDGMPTVSLAEGGAPTITIPGGEPAAETRVAVLKKGDGATVAAGDTVMVQYSGVRWSDGEIFDSSWSKGVPTALVTTDVISGYKPALEGQTVGSQVLVVIPPDEAYGEGEINEDDLTGETLVFVVDILATQPTT